MRLTIIGFNLSKQHVLSNRWIADDALSAERGHPDEWRR